jgi:hypothetical protein
MKHINSPSCGCDECCGPMPSRFDHIFVSLDTKLCINCEVRSSHPDAAKPCPAGYDGR